MVHLASYFLQQSRKSECSRLLALNLAHYRARHGELPLDKTLALVDMREPNEAQATLLTYGMEILVGVLGNVCSGLGEEKR